MRRVSPHALLITTLGVLAALGSGGAPERLGHHVRVAAQTTYYVGFVPQPGTKNAHFTGPQPMSAVQRSERCLLYAYAARWRDGTREKLRRSASDWCRVPRPILPTFRDADRAQSVDRRLLNRVTSPSFPNVAFASSADSQPPMGQVLACPSLCGASRKGTFLAALFLLERGSITSLPSQDAGPWPRNGRQFVACFLVSCMRSNRRRRSAALVSPKGLLSSVPVMCRWGILIRPNG